MGGASVALSGLGILARSRTALPLADLSRNRPFCEMPYVFASWQMVESLSRFSWRRLWVCSHLLRPTRPSDMLKGARICTSHGSQIDGTVPLTVESTSLCCPPERIDAIVLAALSALRLAALRASRARSASARARSSALSCSDQPRASHAAAFASAELSIGPLPSSLDPMGASGQRAWHAGCCSHDRLCSAVPSGPPGRTGSTCFQSRQQRQRQPLLSPPGEV